MAIVKDIARQKRRFDLSVFHKHEKEIEDLSDFFVARIVFQPSSQMDVTNMQYLHLCSLFVVQSKCLFNFNLEEELKTGIVKKRMEKKGCW